MNQGRWQQSCEKKASLFSIGTFAAYKTLQNLQEKWRDVWTKLAPRRLSDYDTHDATLGSSFFSCSWPGFPTSSLDFSPDFLWDKKILLKNLNILQRETYFTVVFPQKSSDSITSSSFPGHVLLEQELPDPWWRTTSDSRWNQALGWRNSNAEGAEGRCDSREFTFPLPPRPGKCSSNRCLKSRNAAL